MKFRLKIAESEECISARSPPHYSLDGKMIEDTTGHETVDRLLILVSGKGVHQLLAVPKLVSETGESAVSAAYETSLSWGLCDQIKCMSFDTTSVNTAPRNGAKDGKGYALVCLSSSHYGHHAVVVLQALGPSTGPDIVIFRRLKNAWKTNRF
jgi:hypothetical protein